MSHKTVVSSRVLIGAARIRSMPVFFHGHYGVLEVRCFGVLHDCVHHHQLLLHARFDGREVVAVFEIVEKRRLEDERALRGSGLMVAAAGCSLVPHAARVTTAKPRRWVSGAHDDEEGREKQKRTDPGTTLLS